MRVYLGSSAIPVLSILYFVQIRHRNMIFVDNYQFFIHMYCSSLFVIDSLGDNFIKALISICEKSEDMLLRVLICISMFFTATQTG